MPCFVEKSVRERLGIGFEFDEGRVGIILDAITVAQVEADGGMVTTWNQRDIVRRGQIGEMATYGHGSRLIEQPDSPVGGFILQPAPIHSYARGIGDGAIDLGGVVAFGGALHRSFRLNENDWSRASERQREKQGDRPGNAGRRTGYG